MFMDGNVMYCKDGYHVQSNVYIWYIFFIKILTFPLSTIAQKLFFFFNSQAMLPDSVHGVVHIENDTTQQGVAVTWCSCSCGSAQPLRSGGHTNWEALFWNLQQWFFWLFLRIIWGTISISISAPSPAPHQLIRISPGRTQALFLKVALQTFPCVWISWRSCPNADSDSFILGGDLRCCGSNEMPGDDNGASPRTPVWGTKI